MGSIGFITALRDENIFTLVERKIIPASGYSLRSISGKYQRPRLNTVEGSA